MNDVLILAGIDIKRLVLFLRGLPFFFRTYRKMKTRVRELNAPFPFGKVFPCLEDRYRESGEAGGHYFHQDLLVARRIAQNNPTRHLDIGSRLDGFVAHVATFRAIDVMDIRPLSSKLPNIRFVRADLMGSLPDSLVDSYDSISSLHVVEHFGLGRYGDSINPEGHLLGLRNIYRILQRHGKFYFSVPIGPQRIEFNAHRVFSIEYLLSLFCGKYQVDSFSFVDDSGELHEDANLGENQKDNCGCHFGCGIFELRKL